MIQTLLILIQILAIGYLIYTHRILIKKNQSQKPIEIVHKQDVQLRKSRVIKRDENDQIIKKQ